MLFATFFVGDIFLERKFLLKRVFDVGGWICPHCSGRLELRAVVLFPPATTKVLAGLGATGPP